MKLTAITITGDRPEAFALCERYVARQTRQPDQWIVVDDGIEPTRCTLGQTYIRRLPQPNDPPHTLILNLREAFKEVQGDSVVFSEDDDWQSPEWYRTVCRWLRDAELVGQGHQLYYHVGIRSYLFHENNDHAALAATAFRSEAFWTFRALLEMSDNQFIDWRLWHNTFGLSRFIDYPVRQRMGISLKGMPGRRGIGLGHDFRVGWQPDHDGALLRSLVGADAEIYEQYARGEPCPA